MRPGSHFLPQQRCNVFVARQLSYLDSGPPFELPHGVRIGPEQHVDHSETVTFHRGPQSLCQNLRNFLMHLVIRNGREFEQQVQGFVVKQANSDSQRVSDFQVTVIAWFGVVSTLLQQVLDRISIVLGDGEGQGREAKAVRCCTVFNLVVNALVQVVPTSLDGQVKHAAAYNVGVDSGWVDTRR